MSFELPALPYAYDALAPHVSEETLRLHHGSHHAGYVDRLNTLVDAGAGSSGQLEALVRNAQGDVFQNAAQAWNHAFLWTCLHPTGGGEPPARLAGVLARHFGDASAFRSDFTEAATSHFGSGWAWLVETEPGRLEVTTTHDADCPLRAGQRPLLVCDLWEHAYYLDHRNDRNAYLQAFWHVVHWDALGRRLAATEASSSNPTPAPAVAPRHRP